MTLVPWNLYETIIFKWILPVWKAFLSPFTYNKNTFPRSCDTRWRFHESTRLTIWQFSMIYITMINKNLITSLCSENLHIWTYVQWYIILGSYECVNVDLSTAYRGQLSMTANGRTCQHWSEQSPHSHSFTEESFEGEPSLNAVMNYCRDPFGEGRTWCYTTESDIAWEYCYFPPCHGKYQL